MTLVLVDDLERPALSDADHHHLLRVLRLRAGAPVTAADGAGGHRPCRLGAGRDLDVVGPVVQDPAPGVVLTVGFALTKGERPELVVQKLTELGVDRIVPFLAERSVARWDGERAARHLDRLRRVAREAAMQAHRSRVPEVTDLVRFADAATLPGAVLAAPGGRPPTLAATTVLVGPEGGWSASETSAGLSTVGLGPHVLRAETAAIAAGAALALLRSGLVAPAGGG